MIESMTGYGKTTFELDKSSLTIEIKSLNSKNLDLNSRITSTLKPKELIIRKLLSEKLKRGKVDFHLYYDSNNNIKKSSLNTKLIREYIAELKNISPGPEIELLKIASKMPEAIFSEKMVENENDWPIILKNINLTIEKIIEYRKYEGESLEKDFKVRIDNIEKLLKEIELTDSVRLENIKSKINRDLSKLKLEFDNNRFEQELIYYIEKLDITEEKVRLKNHLIYFTENLNTSNSNGKKLGFISQEIGREINTIGSKANNAKMQKIVIQMKDELEKIKEQLLNVL
jgi:uncharacterized protein (TIGR00255 family)